MAAIRGDPSALVSSNPSRAPSTLERTWPPCHPCGTGGPPETIMPPPPPTLNRDAAIGSGDDPGAPNTSTSSGSPRDRVEPMARAARRPHWSPNAAGEIRHSPGARSSRSPCPLSSASPKRCPRHLDHRALWRRAFGHGQEVPRADEPRLGRAAPALAHLGRAQDAPLLPPQRGPIGLAHARVAGQQIVSNRQRSGPLQPLRLRVLVQHEARSPGGGVTGARGRGHRDGAHQSGP